MSTADRARPADAAPAPARLGDQELAAIIFRASGIGIPAWRVTTALAVPLPAWASHEERPPQD